jgi:hypothetical protein
VRRDLPQFAPGEGRLRMLTLLHGLGRHALVVMAPGPAFAPGLGRALCDVQPPRGLVAAVAGALSLGAGLSGQVGGPPLCAALLGDGDEAVEEHLGVLDNARAGRDVLHVLLQPKEEGALEVAELLQEIQAAGVEVLRVDLMDEDLVRRALDYLSQRRGPRALVCTDERLADSQVSV